MVKFKTTELAMHSCHDVKLVYGWFMAGLWLVYGFSVPFYLTLHVLGRAVNSLRSFVNASIKRQMNMLF